MTLIQCIADVCVNDCNTIELVMQVLIALFLAILFLQSGFDKVFNYKSEFTWMNGHFSKSPLKGTVSFLFPMIIVLEIVSGILNIAGAGVMLFQCCDYWIYWGSLLSSITLISLFLGQRLAKDYAGAANLVPYFIVTLIGLYLCL